MNGADGSSTGEVVSADQVDRLFEPFQRLHRTADDGHHGLRLSIARAHGAELTLHPQPHGGLVVEVVFSMTGAGEPATAETRRTLVLPPA